MTFLKAVSDIIETITDFHGWAEGKGHYSTFNDVDWMGVSYQVQFHPGPTLISKLDLRANEMLAQTLCT